MRLPPPNVISRGSSRTRRSWPRELREELVEFSQIFIHAYMEAARDSPIWIEDEDTRRRLLVLYLLTEVLHEIESEAEGHPDWIDTPIDGVNAILDRMAEA